MQVAAEQAEFWRKGLQGSGLGSADLLSVRDGVRWQLVTPGAGSAAPLDILPALGAPEGWDPDRDPDAATDRVNGVTSALLSLVGRGGDPLSDRLDVTVGREPHSFDSDELDILAGWTRTNLLALGSNATPAFYCLEVTDGLAAGVALQIDPGNGATSGEFAVDFIRGDER